MGMGYSVIDILLILCPNISMSRKGNRQGVLPMWCAWVGCVMGCGVRVLGWWVLVVAVTVALVGV